MDRLKEYINKGKKIILNAWDYVKKHTVLVGFYLLAFVFFINSIFMTLHYINRNYDYKLLNNLYIEAVLPGQDIGTTGRASTGIVKIQEVQLDNLELGDQIVVCCDFNSQENWVEEVVSIDEENQLIESTYDGILVLETDVEDVFGVFQNQANFLGTVYYTSTFLRGYILLMLTEGILLFLYQRLFVRKVLDGLLKRKQEDTE
jgi:hypothetical protein